MNVTHLECAACGLEHEAQRLQNLCRECGKPLLVRYDLERVRQRLTKESLAGGRADLWRYREVLPVESDQNIVTLGGRGLDAAASCDATWTRTGTGRALHKGRVAEPHPEFQGTRNGCGGFDGEGSRR